MGRGRKAKKPKSTDSKVNEKAVAETSRDRSSSKDLQIKVSSDNYSSKPFERALITWSVSNFAYNHYRKVSLRSSKFHLNAAEASSWYLGLTWASAYDNNAVEIYVIGMCTKPLQKIRFEGRVGYMKDYLGVIHYFDYYRGTSEERRFFYFSVADILKYNFPSFKIVYEVYIYNNSEPEPFVYSLSRARAMEVPNHKVLRKRYIPHTIVSGDNCMFAVDKNICYQSPVLARKIKYAMNTLFVKFNAPETFQSLAYLYLKRLDYLVDSWIAFDLHSAAKSLEVRDLEKLLSATKIDITSKAAGGYWSFIWDIKENEFIKHEAVGRSSCNEILWRIKLNETKTTFQAGVEIVKSKPEYDVHFKLAVIDTEGQELNCVEKSLIAITDVSELLDILIIKDTASAYKCITFSLYQSDMRFKNSKTIIHRTTQTEINISESISDLSIDDDSDIVIIAGDKKFRVHKEILESRSDSFLKLLSVENKSEVTVPDIPADMMELILHFIYNGKLNTRDYETVRRLYKILSKFHVDFLPLICEEFFLLNLEPDNWQDLLKLAIDTRNLKFVNNLYIYISHYEFISLSEECRNVMANVEFAKKITKLYEKSQIFSIL